MDKKRLAVTALMLILAIGSYSRIKGNEGIRAIEFISIFVIGALSAILLMEIARKFRNKQ